MNTNPNYIICHASRYDANFNAYTVALTRVTTRTQAEKWMRANCPSDGDCTANEYVWDRRNPGHFPNFIAHFNQYDDMIEWLTR